MSHENDDLNLTRTSLLRRTHDLADQASWQDFFDTYWKLIYGVSRKAGLTDAESQDVVQEVMIAVSKDMPSFRYDPAKGSFKAWLLIKTRWKIVEQFRRRGPIAQQAPDGNAIETRTDLVQQIPDPASLLTDTLMEAQWEENMFASAWARVKLKLDPQQAQVFDFNAIKGWKAERVAETFQIPVEQVHMTKHRVKEKIEAEVRRLEREAT